MGAAVKASLRKRLWELVEPSLDGYGNAIDLLITALTEDQLRDVVEEMESPGDDE